MRRLVAIALLLPAAATALLATGGGESRYRVDAIFDNTASLIPGQDVKIAGAKVGTVGDIRLTPRRKARVQMEIDPRFGPFHADARCVIRPQSLVGEKFVQCQPGTPRARELRPRDGQAPTVPLERNTAPVDLDVVFSTFRLPYRERLTIITNELGAGLAGRPRDLSEAIRRANPALRETNDVLRVLDRDRAVLGRLVERSDSVLGELSARRREVQGLVEHASEVTEAAASRRDELEETVRRLPPLLAELEPAAERLSSVSREGTSAARRLRQAAPAVRALLADLEPLSDAARPALPRLAEMSRVGRRAVRASRPVARRLRAATALMPHVVRVATALLESVRAKGAVEGLQLFAYYGSAATARFDRFSHILPSFQIFNQCNPYATQPVAGCDAHFGDAAAPRRSAGGGRSGARRSRAPRMRAPARSPAAAGQGAPAAPGDGEPGPRPGLPQPPVAPPADGGAPLLDFLLGP